VVLERVRTADGQPVVLSTDMIATTMLPAADIAAMPLDGSLYEVLERRGHPVSHGVVTVAPERADKAISRRLDVRPGDLLVFLRQIDYGVDGEPLLLSEEHHVAAAFEFSVVRRGPGRRSR
jgi:GntR family transcriptional regulator